MSYTFCENTTLIVRNYHVCLIIEHLIDFFPTYLLTEAAGRSVLKKVFLKIWKIHRKTPVPEFLSIQEIRLGSEYGSATGY